MKSCMYLFLVVIFVIAGCTKDETFNQNPTNLELKKAKVPIPIKADLYAVADMESDPILVEGLDPSDPNNYYPSRMIVSGNGTHIGIVNAEKSFYEFESLVFTYDENGPFTNGSGDGLLVGANGDSFEFTWWVKQSVLNGDYIGGMEIIPGSGTGKFKGSSGSSDIVGGYHMDGIGLWFKTEGVLVFE